MEDFSTSVKLTALLCGPDRRGLVARVANWIFERGGSILHADQHTDTTASIFFQRVEWLPPQGEAVAQSEAFAAMAEKELGMSVQVGASNKRLRVALMVSKSTHCFHDLVLRWQAGEFPCELCCVVSNHPDARDASEGYGLPYFHTPVTRETKPQAEAKQRALFREYQPDVIILARYMQILSTDFLDTVGVPIINIHHSFLPAFVGSNPYEQAYARGVKLIGATAHYVTPELDQGPIIHQGVTRISHRQSIADLVRCGRDLEKQVLAQAVRWHLDYRILVYNNKTVVFD